MKIQELRRFARNALSGNHAAACGFSLLPLLWLLVKSVPDAVALLPAGNAPHALFLRQPPWLLACSLLWEMLCFLFFVPLLCRACNWFSRVTGFSKSGISTSRGLFFWHSLRFFGAVALLRFLCLLPVVASFLVIFQLFRRGSFQEEAGLWLFLAVQCAALHFWLLLHFLKWHISLLAAPFLFLEQPDRPVLHTVRLSRAILRGQYGKILLLLVSDFRVTTRIAMLTLFLQIRTREYLQEQERRAAEMPGAFRDAPGCREFP